MNNSNSDSSPIQLTYYGMLKFMQDCAGRGAAWILKRSCFRCWAGKWFWKQYFFRNFFTIGGPYVRCWILVLKSSCTYKNFSDGQFTKDSPGNRLSRFLLRALHGTKNHNVSDQEQIFHKTIRNKENTRNKQMKFTWAVPVVSNKIISPLLGLHIF